MKILIIEDERLTADTLAELVLELRPQAKILAKIGSVVEAIEWLETNAEPDLIFCDIHLSDGNSFEIFKGIRVQCPVIFTTAYNEYAIEAFQVNSIDYLLKPLDKKEIAKALKKYESLYPVQKNLQIENLQSLLQDSTETGSPFKSRLMAKIGDSLKSIPTKDIAYFLIEDGEVILRTFKGKRYFPNYSLDQLEAQLHPSRFFRANRQIIVNIDAIKEVKPYFKGRLLLFLNPEVDKKLVVSSGKAKELKEWMEV